MRGPRAVISDPQDGATLTLQPIRVNISASDPNGIQDIEFLVNGTLVETSSLQGQTDRNSAQVSTVWTPVQPGNYILLVRARNTAGAFGAPAQVNVIITPGKAAVVEPTVGLPIIVSTVPASAPTVAATPAPTRITPAATPTRNATPVRTPTPGKSGSVPLVPPILVSPIGDATMTCSPTLRLTWQSASLVPNLAGYAAELIKVVENRDEPFREWKSLTNPEVAFTPDCDTRYRWRARLLDTNGNSSEWSRYETFRTEAKK